MATKKPAVKKDPNAPKETKTAKFSRLATARTNKAVKAIRQIANLGGSAYESTPDQRAKIADALESAVKDTLVHLNRTKTATTPSFSL